MALHQRAQNRFQAQPPARHDRAEGGLDGAQSRPSGARQTRLESGPIGFVVTEFVIMMALVALGIPFILFAVLNLIEYKRVD
jgi:hypothetical protein